MQRRRLAIAAVTVLMGVGLSVHVAAKKKAPAKKITIDGCKKKKPPVTFDHPAHVKAAKKKCETCHHKVEKAGKKVAPDKAKCSDCHMKKQGEKLGTCQDKSKKKNPFHVQCIGCHKKAKADKAPTKCKGCHPK
jgi:hypothetical protein